jgi:hypothetical protein
VFRVTDEGNLVHEVVHQLQFLSLGKTLVFGIGDYVAPAGEPLPRDWAELFGEFGNLSIGNNGRQFRREHYRNRKRNNEQQPQPSRYEAHRFPIPCLGAFC